MVCDPLVGVVGRAVFEFRVGERRGSVFCGSRVEVVGRVNRKGVREIKQGME